MDSNPICHPSPAQKKWNAHFWITFNFWWWAGLVDGLIPHPPALSSQKNEIHNLWLCSTSDDRLGWLMDSNPICHPSPAKKMKCLFLDYIHFRWLAGLVNGLEPHPPPLSSQKNEMLVFGLHSTSDDQLGWSMDSNPIGYPSPTKKLKCSFLDYIQLLMIGWAGRWTWTPSATPLQPQKWNACFWITFNFWWLAALVDGLKPHLPPLSSQKNEMLIFGLHSTSDDRPGWLIDSYPIRQLSPAKKMKCSIFDYVQLLMIGRAGWWTWTPSTTPLQPEKWNAHFWITFNFWWLAALVDGLEPHLPLLSSQKNEMLIFGLLSTSDDRLSWLMDSNPICHPSPAKKMKCSFLDYFQLLMISWAGRCTRTPSAASLQPKKQEVSITGKRSSDM